MANQREFNILEGTRIQAASLHDGITELVELRARFDALGGTPGFQGSSKLFAVGGGGQELPFDDFYGVFTALGALEGTAQWPAFLAALARARA